MEPFKNFISPEVVSLLGTHAGRHFGAFDRDAFVRDVTAALEPLELKERVVMVADALVAALPDDLAHRHAILLAMLHPDRDHSATGGSDDQGIAGWGLWPLTHIVGTHGLADFEGSMELLREMTMRGTSEFDVRPFLDADQARALAILAPWVQDENHHVRRWVSEGTRPRLPWGMQLKQLVAEPRPCLPLLFAMRDDPSEYVRRSVANHLNDIAKDHPDLVAELAGDWMVNASKDRTRLVRHACRTLIKAGHPRALAAFGILPPQIDTPVITVETPVVNMGGALEFSVDLQSTSPKPQNIIIDYVVHFQKANGTTAPKVFKWTKLELGPNEARKLARRHPIKPITTRKYYAGAHAVSLRINGADYGHAEFDLTI